VAVIAGLWVTVAVVAIECVMHLAHVYSRLATIRGGSSSTCVCFASPVFFHYYHPCSLRVLFSANNLLPPTFTPDVVSGLPPLSLCMSREDLPYAHNVFAAVSCLHTSN
jgi:hypothetical protein